MENQRCWSRPGTLRLSPPDGQAGFDPALRRRLGAGLPHGARELRDRARNAQSIEIYRELLQ
jgi:hypothetical protein